MKRILFAGLGILLAGTAWAEPPKAESTCIDPQKSYIAQPINEHEVYVKQSIGKAKPPVRVTTSCIHLQSTLGFGFSSAFGCIGQGDTVVATENGGHRQSCRVTKVAPYAPAQGDLKTY